MLRDRLLFGALAGVVANFIMDLFQFPLWKLKIIKHPLGHYAASLFMEAEAVHHNLLGSLVSFLAGYVYSGFLGVIFLYSLQYTGRRFFIAKGLIYGAFLWLVSYGGLRSLSVVQLREVPTDSWDILLLFLLHLLFGLALGWFTKKFGKMIDEKRD